MPGGTAGCAMVPDPDHMPSHHRAFADWSPERFLAEAARFGPNTVGLFTAILAPRRHPEQGFRNCLGILRLFRGANHDRAEAVAARALEIGALSYRSVASILDHNLDRTPTPAAERPLLHANLRGPRYYPLRISPMLTHPTLDQLHDLGLSGMAKAFTELSANSEATALSHAEWLGLLLDREVTARRQKRFEIRIKRANLRHAASVEDVDYRAPRGLDRTLFLRLAACDWIREHRHLIITGPTGVGKSWLACALGHRACRDNLPVLYQRVPRLFATLALGRGDGRYAKLLQSLARVQWLILDDWGPEPLSAEQSRDLLEIVEDRDGRGALLITSQVPVDRWYELIGSPTLADAILDRIVHAAYRIELSGDRLRKHLMPEAGAGRSALTEPAAL